MKKFGIQMYSFDGRVDKNNLADTFELIKKLGYSGVELHKLYGLDAKDIASLAENSGISIYAYHAPSENFAKNIDKELQIANELGCEFIVYPYADLNTADDAVKLGETLGVVAEKSVMSGIRFCYHNRSSEFKLTQGNEYLFDIMVSNTSDLTELALDVGWIKYAGVSPYDIMRKYAGRCPMIHLRQLEQNNEFCALKDGEIDLKSVLTLGNLFGTEHYIAEFSPDTIKAVDIKTSADYLKAL